MIEDGNGQLVGEGLDSTRTPHELFAELDRRYHFVIDLFASDSNALCGAFYRKEEDALLQDWPRLAEGWCFANPPYSRGNIQRVVEKAIGEAKKGTGVVLLIPATTGTAWFNDKLLRCCDVLGGETVDRGVVSGYELSMNGLGYRQRILFLKSRVPFVAPIGWTDKWSGPANDSVLVELRPPLR